MFVLRSQTEPSLESAAAGFCFGVGVTRELLDEDAVMLCL